MKEEIIKPKWRTGDSKVFNEKGSLFVKTGSDTIMNAAYEKNVKVTITEKVGQDYIVKIAHQPTGDLSMSTSVDSLEDILTGLDNAKDVLKDLSKLRIPYKVKVSENGEVIDIVDFDIYLKAFLEKVKLAKGTRQVNDEEMASLQMLTQNQEAISVQLQALIAKESSELLSVYNIQNPINGDIVEAITMPNPKTGEELPATLTYHSKSTTGDVQEIELNIKIHESLNEILGDSIQEAGKDKTNYQDMVNLTTYLFDHKTGWLDSSTSKVYVKTGESEIRILTNVKVH
ncbi:hypothetical protein [Pontibacter mangrovi]|nr:hypothetical protein [Pontibacter mangrovi]